MKGERGIQGTGLLCRWHTTERCIGSNLYQWETADTIALITLLCQAPPTSIGRQSPLVSRGRRRAIPSARLVCLPSLFKKGNDVITIEKINADPSGEPAQRSGVLCRSTDISLDLFKSQQCVGARSSSTFNPRPHHLFIYDNLVGDVLIKHHPGMPMYTICHEWVTDAIDLHVVV